MCLSYLRLNVSGRCAVHPNKLWRLQDRRKTEMLLAPTHEEEITALVSSDVLSEKALPVRLFQIGGSCLPLKWPTLRRNFASPTLTYTFRTKVSR